MKALLYYAMPVSLSLLLSIASTPVQAVVVNADWIHNGSGNYSETTKWSVPVSPCNAGSTTFKIAIPEAGDNSSSGTVSADVPPCEVDMLTLGANYTLKILAGNSYTVLGQADLFGTVHGIGGDFTASTAAFPGNRLRAFAELGATVYIGAINYSSTGFWLDNGFSHVSTYTWNLMTARNPGTVLDLSALIEINAGFNSSGNDNDIQKITAIDEAVINLSGVQMITAPIDSNDRIDFNVSEDAFIELSSLSSVMGNGSVRFNITGNAQINLSTLNNMSGSGQHQINIGHATDFDLMGGEVIIGTLNNVTKSTLISLKDFDSKLTAPGSLLLTAAVSVAAAPDTRVNIAKDFSFKHTDETKLNLESAIVQFNGSGQQFVEVGGFNIGTFPPAAENFGFGQMIIGENAPTPETIIEEPGTESVATEAIIAGPTTLHLRDAVNNGNGHVLCGPGEEALYLLGLEDDPLDTGKIVNGLRILGGSTLVLDGIPLYVMQDGVLEDVRDLFGATDTVIAYTENGSDGFIALGTTPDTDADADGIIDIDDNCALVPNGPRIPDRGGNSQLDTDGDGFGNYCDGDFNDNIIVDPLDFSVLKAALGSVFNPDQDLNGNGIVDPLDFSIIKSNLGLAPGPSCVAP